MNANLYELKTKFNEGTQGNRGRWLLAGLVALMALMAYAQVHNALGSKLLALTSAAQPAQQAAAQTVNSVAVQPSTTTLVLPHYAASARHGAACDELPAGTPGCQSVAVSAPGANSSVTCAPVSRAAQHWDKAYVSPC